jgi:transcriptional antiterminator
MEILLLLMKPNYPYKNIEKTDTLTRIFKVSSRTVLSSVKKYLKYLLKSMVTNDKVDDSCKYYITEETEKPSDPYQ